jgi:ferrochelatase
MMMNRGFDKLLIFPLYPQFAGATTISCIDQVLKILHRYFLYPEIQTVNYFFHEKEYIASICKLVKEKNISIHSYDKIIFSFHGLPVQQTEKAHEGYTCKELKCKDQWNEKNKNCYQAQCYETARLLSQELDIDSGKTVVSFQSRLSNNWLNPFTDEVVIQCGKNKESVLIFSLSFVSDCLETIIEIGKEYKSEYEKAGGNRFKWVPALNDEDFWIEALHRIILKHIV